MEYLTLLALGFGFTALGVIPVGLINLSVTKRAMDRGRTSGYRSAVGAAVVLFLYTFIALYFIDLYTRHAIIGETIHVIGIVLFFALSLYFWFRKATVPKVRAGSSGQFRDFGFGFAIASMNVLFLTYWIFIGFWFQSNAIPFRGATLITTAALGSALGALIVFIGYARLGEYIVSRVTNIIKYTNKALSVLFLLLAIVQLVRFFTTT